MASSTEPRIYTRLAAAALSKGMAVKPGADEQHCAKATASTQKLIGLVQNDPTGAEDDAEIAFPGGGGKGLLNGNVSDGDLLTADSTGALIATTTPGDRYIAMAQQDGVAGDIIAVEVVAGLI